MAEVEEAAEDVGDYDLHQAESNYTESSAGWSMTRPRSRHKNCLQHRTRL